MIIVKQKNEGKEVSVLADVVFAAGVVVAAAWRPG
jgi:hypothetical protein